MTAIRAILMVSGDQLSVTITSYNKKHLYFEGDEDQAAQITFAIPPMVGGDVYTVSEGNLFERDDVMCLKIKDSGGLKIDVEIEFSENTVHKVLVVWH